MKLRSYLSFLLCALTFFSTTAFATGKLTVSEEVTLNAGADAVWAAIGNFGGLHTWHPGVASTAMTGASADAGSTRVLTLGDGAQITEVLVDHNDADMTYSYVITAGPLPVKNYLSTIMVMPGGNGKSKVMWSATFDANGAEDAAAKDSIDGVYKGGFEALAKKFNNK